MRARLRPFLCSLDTTIYSHKLSFCVELTCHFANGVLLGTHDRLGRPGCRCKLSGTGQRLTQRRSDWWDLFRALCPLQIVNVGSGDVRYLRTGPRLLLHNLR